MRVRFLPTADAAIFEASLEVPGHDPFVVPVPLTLTEGQAALSVVVRRGLAVREWRRIQAELLADEATPEHVKRALRASTWYIG